MAADTVMAPVHPGEILLEEFLKPLTVSQYQLAKKSGSRPGGSTRCARPAPHQRGHCAAPGPFLRHVGAVLDQPAVPLRPGDRKDRLGDALDGIRPLSAAS
jgi:hypothetical protein